MFVFRLALQALRWRLAASATVFALSLIGILAATTAPIYLHAVDEAVLHERLSQSNQLQRDLQVSRTTVPDMTGTQWETAVRAVAREAADPHWFAPPVYSERAQVFYDGTQRYSTRLAAIDDVCAHVHMTAGRCVRDRSTDETMISARTASSQRLAVGDVMRLSPVAGSRSLAMRVVGIYRAVRPDGAFWVPWDFFDAAEPVSEHAAGKLDTAFVSHRALTGRLMSVVETLGADVRLQAGHVHVDDLPALREAVRRTQHAASARTVEQGLTPTTVVTDLAPVLDGMTREMSLARMLLTVAAAQLTLLAIFVLYSSVAASAAAQSPELALGRLRGRGPASVALQGVAAPVVLVLVATPVAVLLAWLLVRVAAGHLFGTAVQVTLPLSAIEVAAVAAGATLLAALVAARQTLATPLSAMLSRGSAGRRSLVGALLADAAAVALAVGGLVEVGSTRAFDGVTPDPLAALAPGLIALGAAAVVARLIPPAARAVQAWTADSSRTATFLAASAAGAVARGAARVRTLVLVAAAVALAAFSLMVWSVGRTDRAARALNETGAPTVLNVVPDARVRDLRTAVDEADPGRHSVAVAVVNTTQSIPLVAVDTARYAGVGAWTPASAARSLRDILRTISAPRPPAISFAGTSLAFTVDLTRYPKQRVHLNVDVTMDDRQQESYDLGIVRPGSATYSQALPASCRRGCLVTGLALTAAIPVRFSGPATLARISATVAASADGRPVAGFADPHRWRSDDVAIAHVTGAGSALGIDLQQVAQGGGFSSLAAANVPSHLPAVVTTEAAALYRGSEIHDASTIGLDGNLVGIDGVVRAVSLPVVDRDGVLVDFGTATAAMTAPAATATSYQVWVAPGAPADLAARLSRAGVRVTGTRRAAARQVPLDHSGPGAADQIFLAAAVAAALLGVGAIVLGGVVAARRRGYDLAALDVAGVRRRTRRRAALAEQVVLLAAGTAVGLASGIVTARIAGPHLPFFVDESVGPPLQQRIPWALLGGATGAVLVTLLLVAVALDRLAERHASPGRLRDAG